jgi:hypothetical protein
MTHSCARPQLSRPRRDVFRAPNAGPTAPTPEEIAHLAYSYWEARGGGHGSAEEDWLRAERDLLIESRRAELARLL